MWLQFTTADVIVVGYHCWKYDDLLRFSCTRNSICSTFAVWLTPAQFHVLFITIPYLQLQILPFNKHFFSAFSTPIFHPLDDNVLFKLCPLYTSFSTYLVDICSNNRNNDGASALSELDAEVLLYLTKALGPMEWHLMIVLQRCAVAQTLSSFQFNSSVFFPLHLTNGDQTLGRKSLPVTLP